MNRVRLVSIVHPDRMDAIPDRRFELLANVEATVLAPVGGSADAPLAAVRRVSVPVRGSGRAATLPSLATALKLLDPAVVHLQADLDTKLAFQVAGLCDRQHGFGLVAEADSNGRDGFGSSVLASMRARRVLGKTSALVARSAGSNFEKTLA